MSKRNLAFSKINFLLIAVGMLVVIVGFLLMITPSSDETVFAEEIFSARAIKVAPTICFAGFIFVIYGIMAKGKNEKEEKEDNGNIE